MYSHFTLARKYLHYYLTAMNGRGHGMHSPFVYRMIRDAINNGNKYRIPSSVEGLRQNLRNDRSLLEIEDMGAGSRSGQTKQRTVRQLARTAVKSRKYGGLLYRLAAYFQPQTTIELGTSLGLTTKMLALASPNGKVYTIEGSAAIAARAGRGGADTGNIESHIGNFDDVLPQLLDKIEKVDMAYIDGNHRYEPTMNYFRQLLGHAHEDTVLIFDDIHWSAEMERAWKEIKEDKAVRCTVDLFFIGLVFLRPEFREPQHFKVRF